MTSHDNPHAVQPMLGGWSEADREQWVHDILSGAAPSDSIYRHMEQWQLDALAHTRGLYAVKAWQEQQRRNRRKTQ